MLLLIQISFPPKRFCLSVTLDGARHMMADGPKTNLHAKKKKEIAPMGTAFHTAKKGKPGRRAILSWLSVAFSLTGISQGHFLQDIIKNRHDGFGKFTTGMLGCTS